ncbi:uncharacterized protein ATNIH1004_007905 [Aspergillus tanneri]|uniref:Uncharacterized protein n=1 Tax=Aspergillus tanneri TaxID=1220188 RepID=A0A5M9MHK5_9EURO|nr:uncharacterized protein ATNIH1004_007905 [Aspergillus tanneri]KAA8646472.1 hypothetical protein ATNIH1004_007905 [Aspergillus tanneri]
MYNMSTVLLTDVNRGSSPTLASAYPAHPNHIVIDAASPYAESLRDLPRDPNSRLILTTLECTSTDDMATAMQILSSEATTHLDLVITGAEICPAPDPYLANLDVMT